MNAELSSLGIAQIVESVIADYDLHDEDGNELTDDLYVIRSEQLDELGPHRRQTHPQGDARTGGAGQDRFSRAFDALRAYAANHHDGG